jgi:predicted site-specific integrase-resolvase
MGKEYLSIKEACKSLGIARRTLYWRIARYKLKVIKNKYGGVKIDAHHRVPRVIIPRSELERMLKEIRSCSH